MLPMSTRSKVLIVDDERNMRATLSRILTAAGCATSVAENGEAAVELCRDEAFDTVLMDVRMPGINGVEAFREIRKTLPDCRFILMSAYAVEDLKRAALSEGAAAFLRKPLEIPRLLDLIRDCGATSGSDGPTG
jgi:two-component system NtrC family response regulator/two-component system nitrogen regulation response regulator GlnG